MSSPTHEEILRRKAIHDIWARPELREAYHAGADALAAVRSARRALDVGFDAGADWGVRHPEGGMGSQAAMDHAWAQYLAEVGV